MPTRTAIIVFSALLLLSLTSTLRAQAPNLASSLTVVTWNVESGGADPATIASQIAAFDGVDIWELTEVNGDGDALLYENSAEVARRHFAALDIDYRTVTDRTGDWWSPGPDQLPLDNNGHEAGATATSGVAP